MKNYFEIFDLPVSFDIDLKQLEKNYFQLQQKFHPDKNSNNYDNIASKSLDSIQHSILVNQGYKILIDDLQRAIHLLQIAGINIEDDECNHKPSILTLQTILDLQEQIDKIADINQILTLKNDIKNNIKSILQDFCKTLEINDLSTATQLLIKAKYLSKTLNDLKIKEKRNNF